MQKTLKSVFCSVVNELDGGCTSYIAILQEICNDPNELKVLKADLAYIHTDLSFPLQSITKFVKATNLLSETVKEISDIQDKLNRISGLKLMK
jgi:glutaminase